MSLGIVTFVLNNVSPIAEATFDFSGYSDFHHHASFLHGELVLREFILPTVDSGTSGHQTNDPSSGPTQCYSSDAQRNVVDDQGDL